ncbi:MAG: hypothetical protein M3279_05715, partial [Actinomycetota bacterium]|nr:hypothetical protein [Actinomycetota bacterium]
MSTRSCPRCGADVPADADRCPRGHAVPPDLGGELQDLRAEVDQAFELARKKVATALSDLATTAEEEERAPEPEAGAASDATGAPDPSGASGATRTTGTTRTDGAPEEEAEEPAETAVKPAAEKGAKSLIPGRRGTAGAALRTSASIPAAATERPAPAVEPRLSGADPVTAEARARA